MAAREYRIMSLAASRCALTVGRAAVALAGLTLLASDVSAQRADAAQMSLDSLLAIPVHAAARYAQAMSDAPAAVTVITAEEIAAFDYRTLDQVLARAAGFYTSNDRNYTYIGVRGFSRPTDYNNRVLLLLNGQPINENVFGSTPLGTELGFDLSLIDRVEIVRGPVSALYGTSAMFAVVNLITIEPTTTGGSVSASGGAAGQLTADGRIHGSAPDRSYLVSAQIGREDGEDVFYPEFAQNGQDGVARDLDWTRFASGFASGRIGELRVHARVSNREKGVPTGAWGATFGSAARTEDGYAQIAATYARTLQPELTLSLNLAGDYYRYRGWYPNDGGLWRDATDANRITAGAQTVWDASVRNRVVAGLIIARNPRADFREWNDDVPQSFVDRPFTTAALYLQDEMFLKPWASLVLGGRIDAESGADMHVTPRASLILRPTAQTTLKLLYGEAFRSPNTYELTFNSDVRSYDINPERIRTVELVAEQRVTSAANVRVSLFDDEVTRLIDPVIDPATNTYTFANVGTARTRGVEAEFTVSVASWLVNGGGTVLSATDPTTGDRLTNAPARVFRIGASGTLLPRLHTATQIRTESGRVTLGGSETAPFGLLDLALTYRAGSHVRASASMTNALDQSYAYPAGLEHVQDVIAQDGRRLRLRVEIGR